MKLILVTVTLLMSGFCYATCPPLNGHFKCQNEMGSSFEVTVDQVRVNNEQIMKFYHNGVVKEFKTDGSTFVEKKGDETIKTWGKCLAGHGFATEISHDFPNQQIMTQTLWTREKGKDYRASTWMREVTKDSRQVDVTINEYLCKHQ